MTKKRVAVLFFIEHMLGGLGTQAYDFVRLAQRAGHDAELITFGRGEHTKEPLGFGPNKNGGNLALTGTKLSLNPKNIGTALDAVASFDVRVWVGCAPHLKAEQEDELNFFIKLLKDSPGEDHAFITDRYIDDLYPWITPHLHEFASLYAYADAYTKPYKGKQCSVGVLPLAPMDAWDQRELILPSSKQRAFFWPHQWRGWKNIEWFLKLAPELAQGSKVEVLAAVGGFEYSAYKRTPEYAHDVHSDENNPEQKNENAPLKLRKFAPHAEVLQLYREHRAVFDLTGVSPKLQPNSYVGNYQCATLESMCFGCTLLKYRTTVFPYSGIPAEACAILETGQDLLPQLRKHLEGDLDDYAAAAFNWIEAKCDPDRLFSEAFLSGAKAVSASGNPVTAGATQGSLGI